MVRAACEAGTGDVEVGARGFAERSVRLLLEVVDRRRNVDQLCSVADRRVVESVRTMLVRGLAPGAGLGSAALKQVRVVVAGSAGAEVFASYERGSRTFALAGRVELSRGRWWLVALRMF
ncbi:Rv3235 family protein [Nocardia rhizosphaerae]|uniref:Rv3235 family protein n=1 Tax=Nocardia rhizosphaerae TaxID=1691571 RepID=A0ABV8LA78_9NOCA